jgi:hypothetical protein
MSEMSSLLKDLGDENAMLKKVLAEKEIEATIHGTFSVKHQYYDT